LPWKARHRGWSQYFYTRIGLRLQFLDAELMFSVLSDCFDDGFGVLPVHDSFIVPGSKADRVRGYMDDRLRALIKQLRAKGLD
jgi:hypothetical protein